ncbi:MAG: cytochrome-c peroxidase [Bacteroidetes bacterium]|nr:cytochrome-c peroxidase [Bacteroidota bacterium]
MSYQNKHFIQNLQVVIAVFLLLGACKKSTMSDVRLAEFDPTPYVIDFQNNSLANPNLPLDNPLTIAKVELGRRLFYDRALSLDNSISCATCHRQENAFSDPRPVSRGVGGAMGDRNSMAIVNMAYNTNGFFWDGRQTLLRHQAIDPIMNPVEMKETIDRVINKLNINPINKIFFLRAFGETEITEQQIGFALEAFMLTLVSDDSKFDRYLAGKVQLSDSELRGFNLFKQEYNEFFPDDSGGDCFHCHGSNNFQVNVYRNNGLDFENEFEDLGRENVTKNANNRAQFKAPTLRNIAVSGPYMHDGRFQTLEQVIDHYNNGVKLSSTLDGALQASQGTGLQLNSQEKADIINFLHSLTDHQFLNNPKFSDPFRP